MTDMGKVKIKVKQAKNKLRSNISFECSSLKAGLIIKTIADKHDVEILIDGVQASMASIIAYK